MNHVETMHNRVRLGSGDHRGLRKLRYIAVRWMATSLTQKLLSLALERQLLGVPGMNYVETMHNRVRTVSKRCIKYVWGASGD
jgi:hypothetical protein